ncbi:MAG: hypothetical protein DME19_14795 [Verrucomicrobia bacterium]|nr:MAG: hypothetical protein DME19_14795 [Verrucomicrobiota bacterium]
MTRERRAWKCNQKLLPERRSSSSSSSKILETDEDEKEDDDEEERNPCVFKHLRRTLERPCRTTSHQPSGLTAQAVADTD